jgi:DNA-binding transcriptional ArsR family regulator
MRAGREPIGRSETGQQVDAERSVDAVLKALADRHRRQILRLVQQHEMPAGEIAAQFAMTQQAVSLHLSVLKQAGLVVDRRDGARRLYRFRPEALQPVRTVLDEFWPDALARLKRAVETDHPRSADRPPAKDDEPRD